MNGRYAVDELPRFMQTLQLSKHDQQIAERLLVEINNQVDFVWGVYLTLHSIGNRHCPAENPNESTWQPRLAVLFHVYPRRTESLAYIKKTPNADSHFRKTAWLGNTVIVVEHDEDIIRAADKSLTLAKLVFLRWNYCARNARGTFEIDGLTADYLNGKQSISTETKPIQSKKSIELIGARENNLNNIDVRFPLHCITAVTGVSGSGKSTLVKGILWPALLREKGVFTEKAGQHTAIAGDLDEISIVEYISQNPIGTSSRSNPVTYIRPTTTSKALLLTSIQTFGTQPNTFRLCTMDVVKL